MEAIAVTAADEGEARACLALLPEAHGAPVELLLARLDGAFAGAAGVHWQSWTKPAGFPASLCVLPPYRRKGVGRALVTALADLVGEETDGLWSHTRIEPDGEAERFLLAVGAVARRRQYHFDGEVRRLLDHIAPLAARLRRGDDAGDIAIVPLAEAPLEEIGWLISSELGGGPSTALRRVRARAAMSAGAEADGQGRDRSMAAIRDGEVAGVLIWRVDDDGAAVIDARIVAPSRRGGAVNLSLLEAGLLRGREEGIERMRFHCDDAVPDTIKLARRCGSDETTHGIYYYAIPRD
jgi:GNAT superfamily N-acetyltransferase